MAIQKIRGPDGSEIDAQEIEFNIVREGWNEYHLGDGTIVRVKTTVMKVFQILDEEGNPSLTDEGDPNVLIRSKNEVVTSQ